MVTKRKRDYTEKPEEGKTISFHQNWKSQQKNGELVTASDFHHLRGIWSVGRADITYSIDTFRPFRYNQKKISAEDTMQDKDGKPIVYCRERKEWRAWLESHFETEREVWFVFPAVASGEVGVSYNDAVEEALCFGWIDGQAGTLDEMHQLRRFTPRRKGSPYSQPNIERLIFMDKEGLIHPKVRENAEVSKAIATPFAFPKDILDAIRRDAVAWANYQTFSESYKRIRVAYIDAARKRPDEYRKRLKNFIEKTRENKKIVGYGGVDKYYQ